MPYDAQCFAQNRPESAKIGEGFGSTLSSSKLRDRAQNSSRVLIVGAVKTGLVLDTRIVASMQLADGSTDRWI